MALTYKEGTRLGDKYRKVIDDKVKKILPLLNGLSLNQIEDIFKECNEAVKRFPIKKASHP